MAEYTLQDYLNLIPPPNSIQPNFMAWLEANAVKGVQIQDLYATFNAEFNLDTAVGDQLDILGQILGLSRTVNFQPQGGFNPVLDDATYRLVLKAKIILNLWDGTKGQIYEFLNQFLPQYTFLILDNQDMSMTVLVIGMSNDLSGSITLALDLNNDTYGGLDRGYFTGFSSFLRQLVTNGYFFPKPAGVLISYLFPDHPVLAFDSDTDNLKGLDLGYFAI